MTSASPEPADDTDEDTSADTPTTEASATDSGSGAVPGTHTATDVAVGHVRVGEAIVVFIGLVLLAIAFCLGRLYEVPGTLEFWKVTAQPLAVVTAGLFAISAAVVTFIAYRRTSDSAAHSANLQREKEIRAEALDRCWERFRFIFDTSETGTNNDRQLTPEVVFPVVTLLAEEADALEDQVLVQFIAQWGAFYSDTYLAAFTGPADRS